MRVAASRAISSCLVTRSRRVKNIYGSAPAVLALWIASSIGCRGQSASAPGSSPVRPSVSDPVPGAPPLTPQLTVEQAVEDALTGNPEIRAAVRRLSLAQMKTTTARSLDDPMLMVRDWDTPIRKPWDLNQAQLMVSLQQTIPGKEKRDLRGKIAGDDVGVAATICELACRRSRPAYEGLRRADAQRRRDEAAQRQAAVFNQAFLRCWRSTPPARSRRPMCCARRWH